MIRLQHLTKGSHRNPDLRNEGLGRDEMVLEVVKVAGRIGGPDIIKACRPKILPSDTVVVIERLLDSGAIERITIGDCKWEYGVGTPTDITPYHKPASEGRSGKYSRRRY